MKQMDLEEHLVIDMEEFRTRSNSKTGKQMVFLPPNVVLAKPNIKFGACSGKRCLILGVIILIVLVFLFRVLLNIKPMFVNYHNESDTDGELVVVPYEYAKQRSAFCLDGSAPGYYFRKGVGAGRHNWIIELQPGGWCTDLEDCFHRSRGQLGSSVRASSTYPFNGLLSANQDTNPDFHTWNMVLFLYCDGGSFSGSVKEPVAYHNKQKLYFQGFAILNTVLDYLLETTRLKEAARVLLAGESAGGLAVFQHIDHVRKKLPNTVIFHGLADAGIFIDMPDLEGKPVAKESYQKVFRLQNMKDTPSFKECITDFKSQGMEDWQCFFPLSHYKYIQNPVFVMNSVYDSWTARHFLGVNCVHYMQACSDRERKVLDSYKKSILSQTKQIIESSRDGIFLTNCPIHSNLAYDERFTKISVSGSSLQKAFSNWYYKRGVLGQVSHYIDGEYQFNQTCVK